MNWVKTETIKWLVEKKDEIRFSTDMDKVMSVEKEVKAYVDENKDKEVGLYYAWKLTDNFSLITVGEVIGCLQVMGVYVA